MGDERVGQGKGRRGEGREGKEITIKMGEGRRNKGVARESIRD